MGSVFVVVYVCAAIVGCVSAQPQGVSIRQITHPVEHGEGPHWNHLKNVLNFVDISGHRLYQWVPGTYAVTYIDVGGDIGFAIPVEGSRSSFVAGWERELINLDWSGETNVTFSCNQLKIIARVDNEVGKTMNRFNDAKADASGRLWAGTMGSEVNGEVDPRKGTLYSLDPLSNSPVSHVFNVSVSNGIVWNRDNTIMYYIDSPTGNIDAFDFNLKSGVISGRRTVFSLPAVGVAGVPDGMTIDADGNLWIALWNGESVLQVDPRTINRLLRQISIPALHVTSVAFGEANLATLFVTTSRRGLSVEQVAEQRVAGSVFAVDGLGVRGREANNVVRGLQ